MRKPKYGYRGTVGPARGFTWAEARSRDGVEPTFRLRWRVVRQARLLNKLRYAIARKHRVHPYNDVAIRVTSWYRSPAHNAKVGGAQYSQHPQGRASDIQVFVTDQNNRVHFLKPRYVARLAEKYVRRFANGGIGVYATFTHLDHRRGRARWNG